MPGHFKRFFPECPSGDNPLVMETEHFLHLRLLSRPSQLQSNTRVLCALVRAAAAGADAFCRHAGFEALDGVIVIFWRALCWRLSKQ